MSISRSYATSEPLPGAPPPCASRRPTAGTAGRARHPPCGQGAGGTVGSTIHRVKKTTVYLPDELKHDLARLAAASGRSEAEIIRQAIESLARTSGQPRPKGALFASGDESLSEGADAALAGFGDR